MAEKESRVWSLTEKILASALGPILGVVLYWFWDQIKHFVTATVPWMASGVASWFLYESPVSRWHYLILLALSLSGIVLACARFLRSIPNGPSYQDFTELPHKGFLWRWRWESGRIEQITPYCPNCERLIRISNEWDDTWLSCQNCEHVNQRFRGSLRKLESEVAIEIDHAIRSGTWKQDVEE